MDAKNRSEGWQGETNEGQPGAPAGDSAQCGSEAGEKQRPWYVHSLIEGLIQKLPKAEEKWPIGARKKWLQAASAIFDLIYTCDEDGRSLRIDIVKESVFKG